MSRALLHITKLEEFKAWLAAQGIEYRNPRGPYEILQVLAEPPHWYCIYGRHHMPEHYTVDRRLEPTVRRFINDTKEPPCAKPQPSTPSSASHSSPPWE